MILLLPFQQNTHPSNAGIFLRLMPTGLAYLREIGMKVVNDEVLKISLPTITETVEAGQVGLFPSMNSKRQYRFLFSTRTCLNTGLLLNTVWILLAPTPLRGR